MTLYAVAYLRARISASTSVYSRAMRSPSAAVTSGGNTGGARSSAVDSGISGSRPSRVSTKSSSRRAWAASGPPPAASALRAHSSASRALPWASRLRASLPMDAAAIGTVVARDHVAQAAVGPLGPVDLGEVRIVASVAQQIAGRPELDAGVVVGIERGSRR